MLTLFWQKKLYDANDHCSRWPNIDKNMWPSGHSDRKTETLPSML